MNSSPCPHGVETCPWEAEAKRLEAENQSLRHRVQELQGQVEALKARVLQWAQMIFGRKSEKKAAGKKDSDEAAAGESPSTSPGSSTRSRGQQPGAPGHGRRHRCELTTEWVIHELPEDERRCPHCGQPFVAWGGYETSEEVDWEVTLKRKVHQRRRYQRTCQCPKTPALVAAPVPPKLIPKGLFSVSFIAHLVVEKYLLVRPLNKITTALRLEGLEVSAGTLVGVLQRVHVLLIPLVEAVVAHHRLVHHWQADETGWKVFEEVQGKSSFNWWLWVFISVDTTVFVLDPSRSAQVPRRHFGKEPTQEGEAPSGCTGFLTVDRYAAYRGLEGIQLAYCWAHVRRDFVRLQQGYPETLAEWGEAWVERIQKLFRLHEQRKQEEVGTAALDTLDQALRQAMNEMATLRDQELADATLPPHGHPAALKVLTSLKNHWEGLSLYLDHPQLPMDNNRSERALRTAALARKNFYGSGAQWSASFAATVFTVLATVVQNGLNPLTYLIAYLTACAQAGGQPPQDLERFLPWNLSQEERKAWSLPPSFLQRGPPP